MKKCLVVFSVVASLGLGSAATANDSNVLKEVGMLGESAADCRLPAGPTNQHVVLTPAESGEVAYLTRNGTREFPGTIRDVKVISNTRFGWRASINGTTADVIIEHNGSRYRTLESVRSDGKTLVKNGFMVEFGWGAPWFEKCSNPSTTNISSQATLDNYQDCTGKDHDRAIRGCTELIRVQPAGPFAYYYRALAYEETGEPRKAVADVTEAIRLDPQYAKAYSNRAWMYFEASQLTQGLADIQHALELAPDDPASIDTRAHIYETLGRREEAISDYKRALTMIPEKHSQAQPIRDALKRLGASTP